MENYTSRPTIKLYQQRAFSEKLNATFNFIGQNAKSFFRAQLIITGPFIVVIALLSAYLFSDFMVNMETAATDPGFMFSSDYFMTTFISSFLSLVLFVVMGLVSYVYIKQYGEGKGEPVSTNSVWQEVSRNLGKGLLLAVILFFVVGVASIFLLLPGIYIAVVASLSYAVMVNESAGIGTAFSRPYNLINGKWWSTFGLLFVTFIIGLILNYLLNLPVLLMTGVEAFFSIQSGDFSSADLFDPWFIALSSLLSGLGNLLMYAIINVALAFQYYNLVEMKESKGLLSEIDSVGSESEQDSANEGQY